MQTSHLLQNKPCLLSNRLVSHWPCFKNWVSASGDVNWQYLSHTYGHQEVTVADCATRSFSDQKRDTMSLSEAVSRLQAPHTDKSLPYIKDWHLVLQSRTLSDVEDRLPYQTPTLFLDDCMQLVHYTCKGCSDCMHRAKQCSRGTGRLSILLCRCSRNLHSVAQGCL